MKTHNLFPTALVFASLLVIVTSASATTRFVDNSMNIPTTPAGQTQIIVDGEIIRAKGLADPYSAAIQSGYQQCIAVHRFCILRSVEDQSTTNSTEDVTNVPGAGPITVNTDVAQVRFVAHYDFIDNLTETARLSNCDDDQENEYATRKIYESFAPTPANFDEDSPVMFSNYPVSVEQVAAATSPNQNWCILQFTKPVDGNGK